MPLRQCQGFIDSLFEIQELVIRCPDYSCLSKRLARLKIKSPRYKKSDLPENHVVAIAIDSTGLKRFGRGEWHQERYKLSGKRSWRKLHIAVDDQHIIHSTELTNRFISDDQVVPDLTSQINLAVDCVTADGAYDTKCVYSVLSNTFAKVDIVIPPASNAVYGKDNHPQRNRNLQ